MAVFFNSRYFNAVTNNSFFAWNVHNIPSPNQDPYYFISENENIAYFYMTNIYQGDENPDGLINNINPTGPNIFPEFLSSNGTSMKYHGMANKCSDGKTISANHNIIKNRDITLILDRRKLENCVTSYDLCFDNVKAADGSKAPPLPLMESGIFDGSSVATSMNSLVPLTQAYQDNYCIKNLIVNDLGNWTYINLQAPSDVDAWIGATVDFRLIPTQSSGQCPARTISHRELVLDTHDPNFAQVLCVTERYGNQYVKYRVQCMNDSEKSAQSEPIIEVTFPFALAPEAQVSDPLVDVRTIDISEWNIPSVSNSYAEGPKPISNINASTVTFTFVGGSLHKYNPKMEAKSTAWVEFCVKVHPDHPIDLISGNLQPSAPITNFDNSIYPIYEFIDICDHRRPGETKYAPSIGCVRSLSTTFEDCGCGPQKSRSTDLLKVPNTDKPKLPAKKIK